MTRLAVTADIHCDDFGSKIDPSTGLNARWQDAIDMLAWVARDAAERGADALIVAGDFTEARHPAPWRVDMIREAIATFPGRKVLVRGNHDGIRAGRSIVDELAAGRDGWAGFTSPGITTVGDTAIAVMPFLDRHAVRALPGFETASDADVSSALGSAYLTIAGGLYVAASALADRTVLVLHQSLAGGNMSDTQAAFLGDHGLVVDTRALGALGFDAIVAGHFHLHQVLSESPLIAYAGAPTRTDFGEEHQEKGYLVLDVDRGGTTGKAVVAWTFVPTPARRFVTLQAPRPDDAFNVHGAVVRALDVDPDVDVAQLRRVLEADGAWDVQEIRVRPVSRPDVAGGLAETLSAPEALEAYFDGDPDREVLVERGRGILAEVAA